MESADVGKHCAKSIGSDGKSIVKFSIVRLAYCLTRTNASCTDSQLDVTPLISNAQLHLLWRCVEFLFLSQLAILQATVGLQVYL